MAFSHSISSFSKSSLFQRFALFPFPLPEIVQGLTSFVSLATLQLFSVFLAPYYLIHTLLNCWLQWNGWHTWPLGWLFCIFNTVSLFIYPWWIPRAPIIFGQGRCQPFSSTTTSTHLLRSRASTPRFTLAWTSKVCSTRSLTYITHFKTYTYPIPGNFMTPFADIARTIAIALSPSQPYPLSLYFPIILTVWTLIRIEQL